MGGNAPVKGTGPECDFGGLEAAPAVGFKSNFSIFSVLNAATLRVGVVRLPRGHKLVNGMQSDFRTRPISRVPLASACP